MARQARPKRNVVPDRLDLRDRPYLPIIASPPPQTLDSLKRHRIARAVRDQRDTNACTGFALATVADFLLHRAGRRAEAPVSPFFFYSMARRYDEFPGAVEDGGSSCRGAMKGWYKHGAAASALWTREKMPPPAKTPEKDWWQDAARRPLGAYYRVDPQSVTDMHVALHEVGVLYASVLCHAGWDEGYDLSATQARRWRIPRRPLKPADGGHAFAIVGYDAGGFLVQNSWGTSWGDGGFAILDYEDWLDHAMDCWVAQLGVVTEQHREVARAVSLRTTPSACGVRVSLASDPELRLHEIMPFIVDMENDGALSTSGDFRTQASDLKALASVHLPAARAAWNKPTGPIDIAVYAHGGLTSEKAAAATASRWIPALYEAQIFPIFFMWETDLWSTLKNRLEDLVRDQPRPTGGLRDALGRWWNTRLERLLAAPGSVIWGEMKQNARAIAHDQASGARQLYEVLAHTKGLTPATARLHLIGHSAGSIVHSYLVSALAKQGWRFATVQFMAPAVTLDVFAETVVPALQKGHVERYHQFHLSEEAEQKDPTCQPILFYGRSLLYLVSESFERGVQTPLLGMQRYFDADARLQKVAGRIQAWTAPSAASASTTHGGFDDDGTTMKQVIALIEASRNAAPV